MASVELRGLTKRYGTVAVVDDVSLTIEHGQLVCLLGPSGCGKTTTLRLIAGLHRADGGEIASATAWFRRRRRTLPPEQRNMSMIFQSYALWPHMTVAENVAYGLKLRKLDRATIGKKLEAILATTQARAAGRALSGRAVGRPAAARLARARADRRARDPAARRAAVESRRQSARGDALRGAPPARRLPLHHGLRHARPVRGDDHGRPDRRHEPRQDRAARARRRRSTTGRARSSSRASSAAATSSRARRSTTARIVSRASPLRCTRRDDHAGGADAACRSASTRSRMSAEQPQRRRTSCRRPSCGMSFSAPAATIWSRPEDGTQLRVVPPPAQSIPQGERVWLHLPPRTLPRAGG